MDAIHCPQSTDRMHFLFQEPSVLENNMKYILCTLREMYSIREPIFLGFLSLPLSRLGHCLHSTCVARELSPGCRLSSRGAGRWVAGQGQGRAGLGESHSNSNCGCYTRPWPACPTGIGEGAFPMTIGWARLGWAGVAHYWSDSFPATVAPRCAAVVPAALNGRGT